MRSFIVLMGIGGCASKTPTQCESNDADSSVLLQGKLVHQPKQISADAKFHQSALLESELGQPPFYLLHSHGWCDSGKKTWIEEDGLWWWENLLQAPNNDVADVSACAAACQDASDCKFFAYSPTAHPNCLLYPDCEPYFQSTHEDPSVVCGFMSGGVCMDTQFTAYALLEAGQTAPGPTISSKTTLSRFGQKRRKAEQAQCTQQRDTGGTCFFFGCDPNRGITQCISGKCVCGAGNCVTEKSWTPPSSADLQDPTVKGHCIHYSELAEAKCQAVIAAAPDSLNDNEDFVHTSCIPRRITPPPPAQPFVPPAVFQVVPPTLPPTPVASPDTCAVGADVPCSLGSEDMCAGNQCCPDLSICPSADDSFSECPKPKNYDCTATSPSSSACEVGADVPCSLGSEDMCAGNQCCPDLSTCPSADDSFSECPKPKNYDCTATSPSPSACEVGADVHCSLDSEDMCAGNQCCPDLSTCPSADDSFSECPKPKNYDCTLETLRLPGR